MANIRKYEKTTGYWVYRHTTPNGMNYIGMSKLQPSRRWQPSQYKTKSLYPYIEQYGWENIEHKVLVDGLTKQQAEQWEDKLIMALSMNGLCINERRSGGYARDNKKAYNKEHCKQYYEAHKEEIKAYNKEHCKQYYEDHKEECKARQKKYNEAHKEEIKAYRKEYHKQRYSTPEGKICMRVSAYNRYHPDKAIETPAEAKQKYLETGYIPSYIKNDDLI